MGTHSSPTRPAEERRAREPEQGSVGLLLGFAGMATVVFFLILALIGLAFLIYFYSLVYKYYG